MNVRLVQATFDDENPQTQPMWRYPDGTPFDPDRNTDAFVAMLPAWRRQGMLSFTINLQGGSPRGYAKEQPWHNSAFTPDGSLKPAYMARVERVLDRADALGMAPILGYFYFGQAHHFINDDAICHATDNATDWLLERGYRNVLIEIANESDHWDYPELIQPDRVVELITRVQERSKGKLETAAGQLLVSTSLMGQRVPSQAIVRASDFLLLHGNGVKTPDLFRQLVRETRRVPGYRDQPVICNEDDHFDFDKPDNHFLAAIDEYASWGYFDYRFDGEGFEEGYQSVPVDWTTSSQRKHGFFDLLAQITGAR